MREHILIIPWIIFVGCVHLTTGHSEGMLYDILFQNYNVNVRPLLNYSDTVDVTIGLALRNILHLDEIRQSFKVTANVLLYWKDARLVWNSEEYPDITALVFPYHRNIWIPDLMIYNALEKPSELGIKEGYVRLNRNGQIFMWTQTNIASSCVIETKAYPFDEQTCSIIFINVLSSNEMLKLRPLQNGIDLVEYVEIAEWEIIDNYTKTHVYEYNISTDITNTYVDAVETLNYTMLNYTIKMRRSCQLCFYNIIMPVIILAVLNLLSFFVPCESGEKTSYPIAMFLTLAVFLTYITESLPESVDGVSYLSLYVTFQLVVSAITLFCSVISLQIHHRTDQVDVTKCIYFMVRIFKCGKRTDNAVCEDQCSGQNQLAEGVSRKYNAGAQVAQTFDRFMFIVLLSCEVIITGVFISHVLKR